MRLIYQAQNSVEAHLLLNLFKQAGLKGRIDGEYLQGGIGELQVSGIVRVMIAQEDYQQAKEIVRQWESNEKIVLKRDENIITSEENFSLTVFRVKWRYVLALLTIFLIFSIVISASQVYNASCFPSSRPLVTTASNNTINISLSEKIQNLLLDLLKNNNFTNKNVLDSSTFFNEKIIVLDLVKKGRINAALEHLELLISEFNNREIKTPEYLSDTLLLLIKESS